MTKSVRIENADTSSHKVKVTVQRKAEDGSWVDSNEPPTRLDYPTNMAQLWIHSGQRLIVEEDGS